MAEDNKGKRDQKISLAPIVVEHLKMESIPPRAVFAAWVSEGTLFTEFARIKAAGVARRPKDHYTFHDPAPAPSAATLPDSEGADLGLMRKRITDTAE